jgi:predicted ATPase/DNA-binding SARP family transcriptional activator
MDALRLCLLGTPTVEHGGVRAALPLERRSQLLVLLAVRRGWVARAELASLLWPEQPAKLAYTNLRKTLHRLSALPWSAGLETQGTSALRFEPATDLLDFDAAVRDGRLDDALALAPGGMLLAGFDDDANAAWSDWLRFERDRLRSAWRGAALQWLATAQDGAGAARLAAQLLEADPLDEAALQARITLLARDGQLAAARQAYRRFAERLADELGIEPAAPLKALHDALGAPDPPAPRSEPAPPRAADAGFVGRAVELRRLDELLAHEPCRLIALVGPGGVGKTRLARRLVDRLAPRYADGAVFVALEDVTTPAALGHRLARTLGLARAGRDAFAMAVDHLRGREMLVVLDNFEQLTEHAPLLERLLDACPRVKLLVTSRMRVPLADAWQLPLEGLPFPEPEDEEDAGRFDAVRLFVQSAQRADPAFAPAAQLPAVVDICRRVEGLPLALELAASWVRLLPCDAIAAELRRGSELLRATDDARPARHASIEYVFEQSWQRLSPIEREVLARLTVFRGGFGADAARAVAHAPLAVLGALADKSLLRKDETRLQLHPLVQQLAAERLGAQADAVRAAHASYFHHWLARLAPSAATGERQALLSIDAELENCRAAWQSAIELGLADGLNRSLSALQSYLDHRARYDEGHALMQAAVDAIALRDAAALQLRLLAEASHFAYRLDRYADAEHAARRVLAGAGSDDDAVRTRALNTLAACSLQLGRLGDAKAWYEEVLASATRAAQPHTVAAALDHLALVAKRAGDYDEALRLAGESLARYRQIGDGAGVALCLNNLAALHMARREHARALPYLNEALALCERDGLSSTLIYVTTNLSEAALASGDAASAARHVERAIEVSAASGNRGVHAWAVMQRARVALRRQDLAAARADLAAGLTETLEIAQAALAGVGIVALAELLHAQGDTRAAQRVLSFGAEHPGTSAPDRDEMRSLLAQWGSPDLPPWADAPTLDALLRRAVAETADAHRGLAAQLAAAG